MEATCSRALFASLLLLASCGGGGSTGDVSSESEPFTVLFHDEFDSAAPDEQWTLSGGTPAPEAPPSSLGLGDAQATPSEVVFRRDGGALEFVVAMSWPGDCIGEGRARPIRLVEKGSGLVIASLVVEALPGCEDVRIEYRVDPTGTVTPSSVVGIETWPRAEFADRFREYVLILYEDGRARWVRDGLVQITSFGALADQDLALELAGRFGPGDPVLYDAVAVNRP